MKPTWANAILGQSWSRSILHLIISRSAGQLLSVVTSRSRDETEGGLDGAEQFALLDLRTFEVLRLFMASWNAQWEAAKFPQVMYRFYCRCGLAQSSKLIERVVPSDRR